MSAREEILGRLARQARPTQPPAPWTSRRQFADLKAQFAAALTAASGEAYLVANLEEALAQAAALLAEAEAQTAIADDVPPLIDLDLAARLPGIRWRLAGRDDDGWRDFAAAADAGLSVALTGLAETGTVVVAAGSGRSRLTALLPPLHIALLPANRLTADIFTWAAARQATWPAAVTLISGPSKTADIEQTMAIGVHGPKRFVAILYDEE